MPFLAPPVVGSVAERVHACIVVVLPGRGPTRLRPGERRIALSNEDLPTLERPRNATSGVKTPEESSFFFRHSLAVHNFRGGWVRKKVDAASSCSGDGGRVSPYHDWYSGDGLSASRLWLGWYSLRENSRCAILCRRRARSMARHEVHVVVLICECNGTLPHCNLTDQGNSCRLP